MEIQVERQSVEYEWCCKKNLAESTIGCDVANNPDLCPGKGWYHYSCVNLEAEEIDNIKKYICNSCNLRTGEHTEYYRDNTLAVIDTNKEPYSQQTEHSTTGSQHETSSAMEIDTDTDAASYSENQPPQIDNAETESDECVVKRIVEHGAWGDKTTFLVEWEGFPNREDCTWILEKDLGTCYDLIVEYRHKHKLPRTKLTPRGGALADNSIGKHNTDNWVNLEQLKNNLNDFLEQERYQTGLKLQVVHLSNFRQPRQDSIIVILHKNHFIDFTRDTRGIDPCIKIYGEVIRKVDKLSILGTPITERLELDTKNDKFATNLNDKVQLLNAVKRFDIINSNKDWQTLISSYISSIVIMNNIPVLAIDRKALEWANKYMNEILRIVFDWPNNSSIKAIRLITNIEEAKLTTLSYITKQAHRIEFKDGYDLLTQILNMGGLTIVRGSLRSYKLIPNDIRMLRTSNQNGPIYREPRSDWKFREEEDLYHKYKRGPVWMAHSTRGTASLFLIMDDIIIEEWKGKHTNYPIGHFNMMGLLFMISGMEGVPSNRIIFSKSNSVYMALRNNRNHDWRMNHLKRELYENNWFLSIVKEDHQNHLIQLLKTQALILKRSKDIADNGRQDRRHTVREFSFEWPPVEDYVLKQREKDEMEQGRELQRLDNCTSFMRKLTGDTKCWQTLPPSWIEGRTLMMLSGLVSNRQGTLERGSVELGANPIGCTDNCKRTEVHSRESTWNSETTLHRAFICNRYRHERLRLKDVMNKAVNEAEAVKESDTYGTSHYKPWNRQEAIRLTLCNKRYSQPFLRTLTTIAFKN